MVIENVGISHCLNCSEYNQYQTVTTHLLFALPTTIDGWPTLHFRTETSNAFGKKLLLYSQQHVNEYLPRKFKLKYEFQPQLSTVNINNQCGSLDHRLPSSWSSLSFGVKHFFTNFRVFYLCDNYKLKKHSAGKFPFLIIYTSVGMSEFYCNMSNLVSSPSLKSVWFFDLLTFASGKVQWWDNWWTRRVLIYES